MSGLSIFIITVVLASCCLSLNGCKESNQSTKTDKNGAKLIRDCLTAHGGVYATDSLKISFTATNIKTEPGQSLEATAPFEKYKYTQYYQVDRPAKQETSEINNAIAGFDFSTISYLKNNSGYRYDINTKQYWPMNNSIVANSFLLPQNLLRDVLKSPYSIREDQEVVSGNRKLIRFIAVRGSDLYTLYIDKETMLLDSVEQSIPNGVFGDGKRQIKYDAYSKTGKVFMPTQITVAVTNEVTRTVSNLFSISNLRHEFACDTNAMVIPAGYTLADYSYRKKGEVVKLAEDIYLIEDISVSGWQFSYNILFAEFEDFVLVAEAPLDASTTKQVMHKIHEVAPGKPVRYVVQSHHHDDHLGGIREYIAEGTTIITTQGNLDLLEKISRAPFKISPDRLSEQPRALKTELVKEKKYNLKDKRNEVVVYDIGPNPHAREMLVVYFPRQKLIYQADMINKGDFSINEPGLDFIKKLKILSLNIDLMAGLHGQTLTKNEIIHLLNTNTFYE